MTRDEERSTTPDGAFVFSGDEVPDWVRKQHQTMIDRGYTPHQRVHDGPTGTAHEHWWDRNYARQTFGWPETVVLLGVLAFALFMFKGVPWG